MPSVLAGESGTGVPMTAYEQLAATGIFGEDVPESGNNTVLWVCVAVGGCGILGLALWLVLRKNGPRLNLQTVRSKPTKFSTVRPGRPGRIVK